MRKAILILDKMPRSCNECDLLEQDYGTDYEPHCMAKDRYIECKYRVIPKPDWCPLKDAPDKLSMEDYDEHVPEDMKKLLSYYNSGFNDCLNLITGDDEDG